MTLFEKTYKCNKCESEPPCILITKQHAYAESTMATPWICPFEKELYPKWVEAEK